MEAGDPKAVAMLEALYAENHDDKTVALHLKRLRNGETGTEVIMDDK
jgi:hypothetical protein